MAITELYVAGYRSIRNLRFRLKPVNVLTGPNGCGKSNLYNSLRLLAKAATGGLAQVIAEEGGMPSVLWAGPRRMLTKRAPVAVVTDAFAYEMCCGLPVPADSAFDLDPEVKEEYVWFGGPRRPTNTTFERSKSGVWARDREGRRISYTGELVSNESVLSQLRDPRVFPELAALRNEISSWRFYHHFRTDADSPLRQPQVGVRTPALANDGKDLAAALQTIIEWGDQEALDEAVEQALGGELFIVCEQNRFSIELETPHLQRRLQAQELSDGTLRYLCLVAALLSTRPPPLLALNEPEMSLHPDLLEPLAKLIARAARSSQLWITTHSRQLAEYIEAHSGHGRLELKLVGGATQIVGQGLILPDE